MKPRRQNTRIEPDTSPPRAGLVLLDAALNPLYVSPEAMKVLIYPNGRRKPGGRDCDLSARIRSSLINGGEGRPPAHCSSLSSGRRRYDCRLFSIHPSGQGRENGGHPSLALILARRRPQVLDLSSIVQQFGLTRRESQAAELLARGQTSKEIATEMGVSPNTVKVFLRLVMLKMGVSTRSGIIGRLLEAGLRR